MTDDRDALPDEDMDCPGLWSSEFGMEEMNAGPEHLFELVAQLGADSETDIIGNL